MPDKNAVAYINVDREGFTVTCESAADGFPSRVFKASRVRELEDGEGAQISAAINLLFDHCDPENIAITIHEEGEIRKRIARGEL